MSTAEGQKSSAPLSPCTQGQRVRVRADGVRMKGTRLGGRFILHPSNFILSLVAPHPALSPEYGGEGELLASQQRHDRKCRPVRLMEVPHREIPPRAVVFLMRED